MSQNRKNKNTNKGLASDDRNKITNINKSSSNIQQAVEETVMPIHERAQSTNINKNSANTQQTAKESTAPSYERVQSARERYKNLRLPLRYQTNDKREENQSTNERTHDDDVSTGLYRVYIVS